MNFKNFLLAFFVVSLIACNSKPAYEYNQNLVLIENSIIREIELAEELISKYAVSQKYDSIIVSSQKIEDIISKKLVEIKNLNIPDVKEAENFRSAYIRYMEFMKSIYTGYKRFGQQTTEEGRIKESENLMKLMDRKMLEMSNLQTVQKAYAKGNGLRIEN